jgi:hypothetical protein
MRASVRAAFCAFQTPFEGNLPHMYADRRNLVTCAIGRLIDSSLRMPPPRDPWQPALALPWKRPDGTPATPAEIIAEWQLVKSRQEMSVLGGRAYRAITSLRLTEADIEAITLETAANFETILRRRFVEYDTWPADAQLGILSLAWPEGPGFYTKFPKFSAAADRLDFAVCADESAIPGGYEARNAATASCFNNAAVVLAQSLDFDVLWWPQPTTDTSDNPY